MNNLKICVVGLGAMGRLHISKLLKFKNLVVSGVDSDKKQIKRIEKEFRVPVFQKIKEVSGKIDAAIISTPTYTHYKLGKELLERGIHLFIEKPMAKNVEEAENLCKIAERNSCILQVGHIERFNPTFCHVRELMSKPYMLAFYRLSPFPGRGSDIDVVMDLMIHDIDLSLNLIKSSIKKVEADGYRFISNKPDFVTARITFNNNCIANFISNRVYTHKVRKFYIFEKGSYMIADLLNFKLLKVSPRINKIIQKDVKITPYDLIEAELSSFINCIKNKETPLVRGKDGVKVIKIVKQIQENMRIF